MHVTVDIYKLLIRILIDCQIGAATPDYGPMWMFVKLANRPMATVHGPKAKGAQVGGGGVLEGGWLS